METTKKKRGRYNKALNKIPLLPQRCASHNVKERTMLQWYSYSEEQRKKKIRQTQCPICGHWLYPEEM